MAPLRAGTEPFLPGQALDIEVAFAAYTSGSAWVNHRDDAGRVEAGAVADLVVLDRDPFATPHEIGAARVEVDLDRRGVRLRGLTPAGRSDSAASVAHIVNRVNRTDVPAPTYVPQKVW